MSNQLWTDAMYAGLIQPLISLVPFFVLFFGPMFVIGLIASRRKKKYQAEAEIPFTSLPLRPPGESLRLKIESLNDQFMEEITTLAFGAAITFGMVASTPEGKRFWVGVAGVVMLGVISFRSGKSLFTVQRNLWNHRLGFMGERVVGEALNQLLRDGFHVFHDLPFDGFNIDHVVVGPPGVFTIETKSRRKPLDIPGTERARVVYDGEQLFYPKGATRHGLHQVELGAKTLSTWLSSATGEPTTALPVLVLPGWYVDLQGKGPVSVINEKWVQKFFTSKPQVLSPTHIQRIVHQLTERCRLTLEHSHSAAEAK